MVASVAERLCQAVGEHDLEALVGCFDPDYRNETPVHPARGFVGPAQVRANWTQIFGGVPDISAELIRTAVNGDELWSEWEMQGTRRDGSKHLMRGVVIFGIRGDRAEWARFYLEPVDPGTGGVNEAVAAQVRPSPVS